MGWEHKLEQQHWNRNVDIHSFNPFSLIYFSSQQMKLNKNIVIKRLELGYVSQGDYKGEHSWVKRRTLTKSNNYPYSNS